MPKKEMITWRIDIRYAVGGMVIKKCPLYHNRKNDREGFNEIRPQVQ